jgi:hypothetical protein
MNFETLNPVTIDSLVASSAAVALDTGAATSAAIGVDGGDGKDGQDVAITSATVALDTAIGDASCPAASAVDSAAVTLDGVVVNETVLERVEHAIEGVVEKIKELL